MGAIQRVAGTLPLAFDPDYSPARGFLGPRWVTLGRSRVRASRTLGSVGAKAEWLSYPTNSCCRMPFPQDQRVTGHGHLVLITQRSLVQIQPPQPRRGAAPV